ncbi:hypothetical protein RYX36_009436 [Vicia faba]
MSSPILKGFVPLKTDQLYGMLLNIKEEPQTPNVPPEVMFPKTNATLKEVKKETEVGQPSNAKNSVGDLEKEVSFIKEISKSGSRGNQVFDMKNSQKFGLTGFMIFGHMDNPTV